MFDPAQRFSNPKPANTVDETLEKGADLITASIAARSRRLYPNDVPKRAAYFNAEAESWPGDIGTRRRRCGAALRSTFRTDARLRFPAAHGAVAYSFGGGSP